MTKLSRDDLSSCQPLIIAVAAYHSRDNYLTASDPNIGSAGLKSTPVTVSARFRIIGKLVLVLNCRSLQASPTRIQKKWFMKDQRANGDGYVFCVSGPRPLLLGVGLPRSWQRFGLQSNSDEGGGARSKQKQHRDYRPLS